MTQARVSLRDHRNKPGTVTVSEKPSVDIPPGTLNSALEQASASRAKRFAAVPLDYPRRAALPHTACKRPTVS
ncbi:MAG: type II toxin-antitoxin system HicA family toxin [Betaproteobacteria bacterium]|nr:MAG: type II toxin-antitoxin system HicA family toxin [Betaproteobacteria bacterium]